MLRTNRSRPADDAFPDRGPGGLSRRGVLLGGLGLAGAGLLAACSTSSDSPVGVRPFASATPIAPTPGQRVVNFSLIPQATRVDLGGPTVDTWAYGTTVPGPVLRARAGDFVRVRVDNRLPADTTVHWHGIALRNAADGVPGLTQDPIPPRGGFNYEFTVPDPGTYFFHPHVGVQLDRGLYGALIVDDPAEPGGYDAEWVVILDDWIDGTGTTPDDVLARLRAAGGPSSVGHGMDMGGQASGDVPFGASDVTYPHFLINGRVPASPETFRAKPGQRVRIRLINAASDTIFAVALGGHRMTVTHTDGFPVRPRQASALYLGQGERYDVLVTLADGVFPLVAAPFGKTGQALALVRTGSGAPPGARTMPAELNGPILQGSRLQPAEDSQLAARATDATAPLVLGGQMAPYVWTINGAPYGQNSALRVTQGQRLQLQVMNMSMMTHPLHIHGHTFALAATGLRKDTVLVRPMESLALDLQADNPGAWMAHCHNLYHAEAGMMIPLTYLQ